MGALDGLITGTLDWTALGTPPTIFFGNDQRILASPNLSGSTHTHEASGMQADVWVKANDIVVAFRGTEFSRSLQNNEFRRVDGTLDVGTTDDWSTAPTPIHHA